MKTYDRFPDADVQSGAKIGRGTRIWPNAFVRDDAVIGHNCNIGRNVIIDPGTVIGDDCKIGANSGLGDVTLGNGVFWGFGSMCANDIYPDARVYGTEHARLVVGDGASIGDNCTIRGGITIGERALIGMGSVVTKDVPPGEIWAGNPARKLRDRGV